MEKNDGKERQLVFGDIDEEQLLLTMLKRSLEDFAILPESNKWFEAASGWLFGESRILLASDNRLENFTLEDVCEFFGGKNPQKVRDVALTMRRFGLNMKQFIDLYWSDRYEDDGDAERYKGKRIKVVWHRSRKGQTTIKVIWEGRQRSQTST